MYNEDGDEKWKDTLSESAIEREVYSALLKEDEPYYKLVGAIKCLELGTATADAVGTLKKLRTVLNR